MAPAASTMAATFSLGAAAVLSPALSRAFVLPAQHPNTAGSPQFLGRSQSNVAAASQLSGAAVAATALGLAALAAGSLKDASRVRRSAPAIVRSAEAPFAGGLIGGQSAFSGQDYNFDPLGLSVRAAKFLPWFRESELKHGRIAMLAWVGLVVPEIVRIPGPESCYTKSVLEAYDACIGDFRVSDKAGPLTQVWVFVGIVEMLTTFPKVIQGLTLENAGDYQFGVGFFPKEEAKVKEMKLRELKNGRLAMLAVGGAVTQAILSGNGFPWLYGDRLGASRGPGLASGVRPAGKRLAASVKTGVAMRAEGRGYKMSTAVPFLPLSPALEGYVGEEDGFDPMGFSLAFDIRYLREGELKNGRVAMLATVGWIATDLGLRVPGEPFQNVSTMQAHDAMIKFGSMPQLLCWIGYAELYGFLALIAMMEGKTDRAPGDFGFRFLYPSDPKGQYDMQKKELTNGRLAMLAFGGIATAAELTGKTWPFFAVGTSQRTIASMPMGKGATLCSGLKKVQPRGGPVAARAGRSASLPFLPKPENVKGFVGEEQEFDPLGFSDTFDMKWLRESELKHGRVCMLAVVGFVAQQYITFPGVTPNENSLMAVYTAPVGGMAALLFLCGYIESASYGGKMTMLDMFEGGREVGNFNFGAGFLKGKSDKEVYDIKLKEINNGRLAMCAIGGMVHHNLVVKGPLFPTFPDGWAGPQGSWGFENDSVTGAMISGLEGLS